MQEAAGNLYEINVTYLFSQLLELIIQPAARLNINIRDKDEITT